MVSRSLPEPQTLNPKEPKPLNPKFQVPHPLELPQLKDQVSHSLNSLKGGYKRDHIGDYYTGS